MEREEFLEIIRLEVLNFFVVDDKSYFFGRISRENIFWIRYLNIFFIYLIIIMKLFL